MVEDFDEIGHCAGVEPIRRKHGMHFATCCQAADEVIDWFPIHNHRRLHSAWGISQPDGLRVKMAQLRAMLNAGKFKTGTARTCCAVHFAEDK